MGIFSLNLISNRLFYPGEKANEWSISQYLQNFLFFILFGYFFSLKFPIVWNSNDDFVMRKISEGFFSKDSSEYLIFINPLIGFMLKFLYFLKPGTQWYSWFFVFMYALCNSTFSFLIFRKGFSPLNLLLFSFFLILFFVKINTEYQFTILSSYMAISGYFLLFLSIYNGVKSSFWTVFSCLFLLVSSMIRMESFMMITVFFVPFLIFFFRSLLKLYWFVSITLLLIVFSKLFFTYYYSSEEWKFYKEYNSSRAIIVDSPPADYNKIRNEIENEGWKIFDLELFKEHYFESSETFSIGMINKINQVYKRNFLMYPNFYFVRNNIAYFLILSVMLALSMLFFNRNINLLIFLSVLICFLSLVVISVTRKIPERVYFSFLLVSFMSVFMFNSLEDSPLFKRFYSRINKLSPYLFVLLFWFGVQKLFYAGEVNARQIDLQQKLLSEFQFGLKNFVPRNSELGVITNPATGSTFFSLAVFEPTFQNSRNLIKPIFSGWLTKSPLKKEYMRQFGDEEKPDYQLAIDNPKVVFLDGVDNSALRSYLSFHYADVRIDTFYFHPGRKFCAFRLLR